MKSITRSILALILTAASANACHSGQFCLNPRESQLDFDCAKSQLNNGLFTFEFPDEIMLEEGNYYVELEFLENFSNEFFIMRSKPMTGRSKTK